MTNLRACEMINKRGKKHQKILIDKPALIFWTSLLSFL